MATKENIYIDQGTTFSIQLSITDEVTGLPVNLSTYYVGASQIRKHYSSSNAVNMNVSLTNTGLVILSLSADATANMQSGRYVYDVTVTDFANNVSRVLEGIVTINPYVTK